ncbi:MAG: carboxypeptidase-like regulatory domain-containing protein [Odoribacter sp.]
MKKSVFSKLSTWCVLILTVVTLGSMASCKDDDENPDPSGITDKVSYTVNGKITDDSNKELNQVEITLSGAQSMTIKSDAKGEFKFDLGKTPGAYTLNFKLEGYKSVSSSIDVKELKSGNASYTVNAMMVKTLVPEAPLYKTPTYSLKVEIKGAPATGLNVKVSKDGFTTVNKKEATFTLEGLVPGVYDIEATADGYTSQLGGVMVNEVGKQIRTKDEAETFNVSTGAAFTMTKQDKPAPAAYSISGKILDASGNAVNAQIVLTSTSQDFTAISKTGNEYTTGVAAAMTVKDVYFTLSVTATGYVPYSYLFQLKEITAGQQLNQVVNVVLSKEADKDAIKYVTVEPTVTNWTPELAKLIELTKKQENEITTFTINKPEELKIAPIKTTSEKVDGTKEVVEDKVVFTKEASTPLVITFPKGETNNVISFNRNVTSENKLNDEASKPAEPEKKVETAVVERIYEGTPSGTTFSSPVKITFPAPYKGASANDGVKMNLLYQQTDKSWAVNAGEENNYVEIVGSDYVASVHHFSSFAPGFATSIVKEADTTTAIESRKYEGQSFKDGGNLKLIAKVEKGMIYDGKTAKEVTATALTGKSAAAQNYIVSLLEKKIKADNAGMCPTGKAFGEKKPEVLTFSAANEFSIDHLTLTTTYVNKTYTITVEGKIISVKVKIASSHTVVVSYTQTHTGHGPGLNAGGGIVDFE